MKKGPKRLHFSVVIFLVCLLFTFLLWDHYFNSNEPFNRDLAAKLIFLMGLLFSASAGLFAWSLETRQEYLEREVQRKTEELSHKKQEARLAEAASCAIYQSCHILFSDVRMESILDSVMDLISKVFLADEGSLMLLDQDRKLYIAASRGIPEHIVSKIKMNIGERVAGRVAALKREFLIVDGLQNYPEFQGIDPNPLIKSSIVCPLIFRDEVLGVLNLNRKRNQVNFTVTDLMSATIFATLAAQAIRNARLYKNLEDKIRELEEVQEKMKVLESQLPPS